MAPNSTFDAFMARQMQIFNQSFRLQQRAVNFAFNKQIYVRLHESGLLTQLEHYMVCKVFTQALYNIFWPLYSSKSHKFDKFTRQ